MRSVNILTAHTIKKLARLVADEIDTRLLYPEHCYQTLLQSLLRKAGLEAEIEVDVFYKTRGNIEYGQGRIDILVTTDSGVFVLELKANCNYSMKYKAIYQTQRYLTHYHTAVPVFGMVVMYNSIREKSKYSRRPVQIYDVPGVTQCTGS